MSKVIYKFNPKTLSYEKVEKGWKGRAISILYYLISGFFSAIIIFLLAYSYIDTPQEIHLKQENAALKLQYKILNEKIVKIEKVLADIEKRDDNIYRVIFESKPIPKSIREAGFGGVNRYKYLEGYSNSKLMIETTKKIEKLSKQIYIQSRSFDEIMNLVKKKEKMLSSIPAIQPIKNKDLKRIASGFGYRIDPIYKTKKFHTGIDFSAPVGTKVYATGDGVVIRADNKSHGYGNHIRIDHGFGYITLYGHLSKILVKPGQKVNRGEVIALVGNTGKSVGPHLHYEVHKNGEKIDPVNFFFQDLTPEEYDRMIEISSNLNQSFD